MIFGIFESIWQLLAVIIIAFIPIFGWLYFFNKQHPEKRKYVILTFFMGIFSVIPIKLYEKYWDIAIFKFEHLNIFKYLAKLVDMQNLPTLMAYVSVDIIVAFLFFIFIAVAMYFMEVLSGDNAPKVFVNKTKKIIESPFFFISVGILIGLLAYLNRFLDVHEKVWFFVGVGMMEEFVKHLVLRFADEEKIKSVDDALEFSIIIAIGFAFAENILYFGSILAGEQIKGNELIIFFLLRSTVSVAAHICFSSILGYFYGVAKFSSQIYQEEARQHQHPVIKVMRQILHLKSSTLFHEEKMMEGMLLAIFLHAIFNSLLDFGKIVFVFPFILLLLYFVLHLFHRKEFYINNGQLTVPIS